MKRKLLKWITLLLMVLPCICSAAQDNLVKIGNTSNGVAYIDSGNVTAIKKDNKLFVVVPMEEHYTNPQFLAKLRNSGPKLKKASMTVYLYMFNNNGTKYCIVSRFITDKEGKICADLGKDLTMKSVDNSVVLIKAYEAAYSVLERKQKLMQSIKRGG